MSVINVFWFHVFRGVQHFIPFSTKLIPIQFPEFGATSSDQSPYGICSYHNSYGAGGL